MAGSLNSRRLHGLEMRCRNEFDQLKMAQQPVLPINASCPGNLQTNNHVNLTLHSMDQDHIPINKDNNFGRLTTPFVETLLIQ
uniref:Uncharacterized protein n=1 Tax=Romanomermis culicivorax TaxID=13658 RepID=A0A915IPX9_ROMCU